MTRAVAKSVDLFAGMNKTEAARALELEAAKRNGDVASWRYEAVTFKLADDCRYTPDFFVVLRDGSIHVEEVKGFWRDDARVKIRVAAQQFPEFTFIAFSRNKSGGWHTEEF